MESKLDRSNENEKKRNSVTGDDSERRIMTSHDDDDDDDARIHRIYTRNSDDVRMAAFAVSREPWTITMRARASTGNDARTTLSFILLSSNVLAG